MVIQFAVPEDNAQVILSVKRETFSVSIDTQDIYYFDLEGRLAGAWVDGCNYKRTLDSRLLRISRSGNTKGTAAATRKARSVSPCAITVGISSAKPRARRSRPRRKATPR